MGNQCCYGPRVPVKGPGSEPLLDGPTVIEPDNDTLVTSNGVDESNLPLDFSQQIAELEKAIQDDDDQDALTQNTAESAKDRPRVASDEERDIDDGIDEVPTLDPEAETPAKGVDPHPQLPNRGSDPSVAAAPPPEAPTGDDRAEETTLDVTSTNAPEAVKQGEVTEASDAASSENMTVADAQKQEEEEKAAAHERARAKAAARAAAKAEYEREMREREEAEAAARVKAESQAQAGTSDSEDDEPINVVNFQDGDDEDKPEDAPTSVAEAADKPKITLAKAQVAKPKITLASAGPAPKITLTTASPSDTTSSTGPAVPSFDATSTASTEPAPAVERRMTADHSISDVSDDEVDSAHDDDEVESTRANVLSKLDSSGIKVKTTEEQAIIIWARKRCLGYEHIGPILDFGEVWTSGMAFCAIIDSYHPELIRYKKLNPRNVEENLKLAFGVAEKEFGIHPLLDVEDLVNEPRPDEELIQMYLDSLHHHFEGGR